MSNYFLHETSYVDEKCVIGDDTKIWHFSHIMNGSNIGKKCTIGQNVFIGDGVIIGDSVKIQNNVSVFSGVQLEDYVFCGPSVVFTNVINPRSEINRKSDYKPTLVKRGATIGANATIVCGTTIGKFAFVAAGAVVSKDVPDYALVMGVPSEQKGWMSRHGYKLPDPDENGLLVCPGSNFKYMIHSNGLKCVDLDEGNDIGNQYEK
jgi:UDP-2-acetamido-3-amino-2,3-dideoxy-glucuronate N-acetyltransferase|tara:strand:- start:902 stop:1519 length:618 start_codon:yes stop_codon:yes gene_type:complete